MCICFAKIVAKSKEALMQQLMIDFITSLDGYGAAEGWPGWWGLQGPEYLEWLDDQPSDYTILMGANTYRLMHGFAAAASENRKSDEDEVTAELNEMPKVVFSSTLQAPLEWANTQLVDGNGVEAVRKMKVEGDRPMHTLGSLTLCRSLIEAGLVDRFRVVVFPVITGKSGSGRIYDNYPDLALDLVEQRTFDGRTQLLEYVPTVLDGPPGESTDV
jgi:dihydrofolate reductase